MAENVTYHGSWVGDTAEEFKKLPTWGKVAAGLLFVVVAYLGYRQYRAGKSGVSGAATPSTDLTGTGAGGGATLGGVPIIPSGYGSVYNPTTGVLEGYQPITPSQPTGNPPLQGGNPPVSGQVPTQGSTFFGPSGVRHYVATGNESLSDIAKKYGLSSWNSIYAIPQNQKAFGALNSKQAAAYRPPPGAIVTLPGGPGIVQAGGQNGATQLPATRLA